MSNGVCLVSLQKLNGDHMNKLGIIYFILWIVHVVIQTGISLSNEILVS